MNVSIIGLGLMGASLGLALRDSGARVFGYARREEARKLALERGMVDDVTDDLLACIAGADVSVFCTPVLTIIEQVRHCAGHFVPGSLVTDVASTKGELVGTIESLLDDSVAFVGSHPMVGSERSGLEAARVDLYRGGLVILTPREDTEAEWVQRAEAFWRSVGAHTCSLVPKQHDETIASTSHLPHLIAAMLVQCVLGGGDAREPYCGAGFRDTTRVAAGDVDLWHDIVRTNRDSVAGELAAFREILTQVEQMVASGDDEGVRRFLEASRNRRIEL